MLAFAFIAAIRPAVGRFASTRLMPTVLRIVDRFSYA
jgi:hypothetical protein